MKETRVGEFEEVVLLLTGILGEEAYAYRLAEAFTSHTGRTVSIGAVHSALTRLEAKGFLRSKMGAPTATRGGRRKRVYTLTAYGQKVITAAREFRISLWRQFPAFANKYSMLPTA